MIYKDNDLRTALGDIVRSQLGNPGTSLSPVQEALSKAGLRIHEDTIALMRNNPEPTGYLLGKRLMSTARQKEQPTPSSRLKNNLFWNIAATGLLVRQPQAMIPSRFVSLGFTQQIARHIDMDADSIDRLRRSMRVELIYAGREHTISTNVQRSFESSVKQYLATFSLSLRGTKPDAYRKIAAEWCKTPTVEMFYKLLGDNLSPRSLGTWSPFEAKFMYKFFTDVRNDPSLTTLDQKVLTAYISAWSGGDGVQKKLEQAAEEIKLDTGITYNYHTLHDHLNILVQEQANRYKSQ